MSNMTDDHPNQGYAEGVAAAYNANQKIGATDETYSGWANRETWAFNLHWQNDQGLYNWVLRTAQEVIHGATYKPTSETYLGEQIVGIVREELADMSPELWENMREDVGSWWRIEVGAAVRESLDVES